MVGNEARGLNAALSAALDGTVTIPMAGSAESLNVAMATTVLCFEAARQRAGAADEPRRRARAGSSRRWPTREAAIGGAASPTELDALEREHLKGRGSAGVEVNEAIKTFAPEDRPRAGQAVGGVPSAVGEALMRRGARRVGSGRGRRHGAAGST